MKGKKRLPQSDLISLVLSDFIKPLLELLTAVVISKPDLIDQIIKFIGG